MIVLGLSTEEKVSRVDAYVRVHGIKRVFVLAPAKFRAPYVTACPLDHVEWAEIIQYKFYYRLLQEIDRETLVVVDECLRTQNRHELTYNCIRLFLQQTEHRLVFQYLPLIDTVQDFMVLFDFDTRSRWKREPFRRELLGEATIEAHPAGLTLHALEVTADAATRESYTREKRALFEGLGLGDPHTLPRQLHLLGGKTRLRRVDPDRAYLARNRRFKLANFTTYREATYPGGPYTLFDFCHDYRDMIDVLTLTRQTAWEAIVSDLKADRWYLERYTAWMGRLRDAYSIL